MEIKGLTQKEADKRLKIDGLNDVPDPKYNFWQAFASKLWNISAWILEAALILECFLGKWIQSFFVLLMLLFAAFNGATQKKKSRKVLNMIAHKLNPLVIVKRDNIWKQIDAKFLVIGDLISLKKGDILGADAKLVQGHLQVDQSAISGESNLIDKKETETIFGGSIVIKGEALATIMATGKNSRNGKTINLINTSAAPGHLQKLLTEIIYYLCLLDGILTLILIFFAIIHGKNILDMLPFLAMMFIASIPVAMPSTFALSNSFEATKLSQEGVLTADLTGIQDAANLNLLLLDKTGTITENKTSVFKWYNLCQKADKEVLSYVSATLDEKNSGIIDDAIFTFLKQKNIKLIKADKYISFTSDKGYSQAQVGNLDLKLGSFKQLSQLDTTSIEKIGQISFENGRSVAFLINNKLAGIFILKDTIRPDAITTLQEIKNRGIKAIMLTGDNQKTAQSIAAQVGLQGEVISINNFTENLNIHELAGIADVLPEDKLFIVKLLQQKGFIVGMTGDGVNDAPALKQAEVGIAMHNATDIAKKSSKMVLLQDGLSPIIKILDAGHRVYHRMTTWSLTKLSRTAELTMLLTIGFICLNYIPMALNAMVIYTIMNNMVTMMIGTDNTYVSYHPENWDILKLAKRAFSLASGFMLSGLALLYFCTQKQIAPAKIGAIIYIYLVFSAMLLVLITRSKTYFWKSLPSKYVYITQLINIVITLTITAIGLGIQQLALSEIGLAILFSLLAAIIIDVIYKKITVKN